MAAVVMRKLVMPLDRAVQVRTCGRFSAGRVLGISSLLLTTVGARSGRSTPTPLFYVDHAGGYAVVASNFGLARHPGWSVNLLKEPVAAVCVAGRQLPVSARLLTGGERDGVWRRFVSLSSDYQDYQERSGRDLRIFHLQL
ncbi:nitroreductase family deazaflavin-dependent oxidoreductase [Streptomyces sp. NPDC060028]|uniref:nitroreductase family deazaflavin-dependent oxidoreductase n=1 Tax=Streptomyces sp. NPDC060028 TaxID=3347041 RepID=UPI0036B64C3A